MAFVRRIAIETSRCTPNFGEFGFLGLSNMRVSILADMFELAGCLNILSVICAYVPHYSLALGLGVIAFKCDMQPSDFALVRSVSVDSSCWLLLFMLPNESEFSRLFHCYGLVVLVNFACFQLLEP